MKNKRFYLIAYMFIICILANVHAQSTESGLSRNYRTEYLESTGESTNYTLKSLSITLLEYTKFILLSLLLVILLYALGSVKNEEISNNKSLSIPNKISSTPLQIKADNTSTIIADNLTKIHENLRKI